MDRLKGENEALLKRLREVGENKNGARADGEGEGDEEKTVPRESWDVVRKEKAKLEEVVKQKEKRLLRLQQVRSPFHQIELFLNADTMYRCLRPKAPNSAKPSHLSSA